MFLLGVFVGEPLTVRKDGDTEVLWCLACQKPVGHQAKTFVKQAGLAKFSSSKNALLSGNGLVF